MRKIEWSDFFIKLWLVLFTGYLSFVGVFYQMQQINKLKVFSFWAGLFLVAYFLIFLFTDKLKQFMAKLLKFIPIILLLAFSFYFFIQLFIQDWLSVVLYTTGLIILFFYLLKKMDTRNKDNNLEIYDKKGKNPLDIPKSISITPNLKFYAEIKLRKPDQNFTVYYCFQTDGGGEYWIGFSHPKNRKYIQLSEHTYPIEPIKQGGRRYKLEVDVLATINERFGENLNGKPILIKTVRLRGDSEILDPIKFSFKFKDEERNNRVAQY